MDLSRIPELVASHFGDKPHPDVPELKVNEYEAFARVAARMHGTSAPEPAQVQHAYHALAGVGVSPAEFERVWDLARPLANHLLAGRDPTLHDLGMLAGKPPDQIQAYYLSHPHPDAPDVPAGKMAEYADAAKPIARRLTPQGRDPNHIEVARFARGDYDTEDMIAHYQDGRD